MLELNRLMLKEIVGGDNDCDCICYSYKRDIESDGTERLYPGVKRNVGLMSEGKCHDTCEALNMGEDWTSDSFEGFFWRGYCK